VGVAGGAVRQALRGHPARLFGAGGGAADLVRADAGGDAVAAGAVAGGGAPRPERQRGLALAADAGEASRAGGRIVRAARGAHPARAQVTRQAGHRGRRRAHARPVAHRGGDARLFVGAAGGGGAGLADVGLAHVVGAAKRLGPTGLFGAGCGAADLLRAVADARAAGAVGVSRADSPQADRWLALAADASEPRRAGRRGVAGAAGGARVARADVPGATGDRRGRRALAGAVADADGPRHGGARARHGDVAGGHRRGLGTPSAAVAEARVSARRAGRAHRGHPRGAAGRDRRALADVARHQAALAAPSAGAIAAHTLRASIARAVGVRAARLSVRQLVTAAVVYLATGESPGAVGVRRASRQTRRARRAANVGVARRGRGRRAGPRAVAVGRHRQGGARAALQAASGAGRPGPASPGAVAGPVVGAVARGRRSGRAAVLGIGVARGHRRAGADLARDLAAAAQAAGAGAVAAGRVAADPLGAEARGALAGARARRAVGLEPARAGRDHAGGGRDAIPVGGAGGEAGVARAFEVAARTIGRGHAHPRAVARRGGLGRRHRRAARLEAPRTRWPFGAGAPLAASGRAARVLHGDGAHGLRVDGPVLDRRADAHAPLQVARDAGGVAGRVAAHALGAVLRLAIRVHGALGAERLEAARAVEADVARRAVGVLRALGEALRALAREGVARAGRRAHALTLVVAARGRRV